MPPSSGLRWTTRLLGLLAAAVVLSIAGGHLPSTTSTAHAAGTGTIVVCLRSSTDSPIPLHSSQAVYQPAPSGSTNWVSDASGDCRQKTVNSGSYNIWVNHRFTTSATQVVDIADGETETVTFYTTAVTLHYTKSLAFGGPTGDYDWFDKPTEELLGDDVQETRFRLDGTGGASGRLGIVLPSASGPGNNFSATLIAVRLIDSNGDPLAGGTASAWRGAWTGVPGETGADGILAFALPGSAPVTSLSAAYKGTAQQINQSSNTNSVYTFQTEAVSVQLRDADGQPLQGGSANYYAAGWQPSVLTDVNGEVVWEMLPGTYSFAMSYNGSSLQKSFINITTTNPVIFQTGRVTIYYSGTANWYHGGWHVFSGPEELLPGTIPVYLQGSKGQCTAPSITVTSGAKLKLAAIYTHLRNSANASLPGGAATAYVGGWKSVGTTNSAGLACNLFDVNGALGNTSVRMSYNGSSQQLTQNHAANSQYLFQATGVTVELRDSSGALIDTGNASYYAGGWHSLAPTSGGKTTVSLLPGSYSFAMTYNGTRQQINGEAISGSTDTVTFQTVGVDVTLIDSEGAPLANGNPSYYAGGWHNLAPTDEDGITEVEMLPGSYSFAMTYNGTRQQLNSEEISGVTDTVTFQTVGVNVELRDHLGVLINSSTPNAGTASYYAGGWHQIGDTAGGTVHVEMLPGSYSFAMTYKGTRQQLNGVNISVTNPVVFQTGEVISLTATAYYAGGWRAFDSGDQLLPGTYTFKFSNQGNQAFAIAAATTNNIP